MSRWAAKKIYFPDFANQICIVFLETAGQYILKELDIY